MEKVLLTGKSGFVGRHLYPQLNQYYDVASFERGHDPEHLLEGVDYVVHLAGKTHARGATKEDYRINNIELTRQLVEAAKRHKIKRFIFVSTSKVYGEFSTSPWDENSPCETTSDYGLSKLECEKIIIESGLDYVIFRPPLILGGMARGNLGILNKAMSLRLPLPGNISNQRSFVDLEYFCDILKRSIENPKVSCQILNIANKKMSTSELFTYMGHKRFINVPHFILSKMPEHYKVKLTSDYELDLKKNNSIFSDLS